MLQVFATASMVIASGQATSSDHAVGARVAAAWQPGSRHQRLAVICEQQGCNPVHIARSSTV